MFLDGKNINKYQQIVDQEILNLWIWTPERSTFSVQLEKSHTYKKSGKNG